MSSFPFVHDLIDGLDVLICGLDDDGRICVFNRSCERLSGFDRDKLLGRSWLEMFAVGSRAEHVIKLWEQARAEHPHRPFEALGRNGRSLRWQFSHSTWLPPVSLWAVGIDVTDEREAMVRARQVERMVALGNLVSGLTHEMRNPLNGALLQLALADRTLLRHETPNTAPAIEAISQARTEIRRIATLLDDFLVFVRPQPMQLERLDVRQLVAHAVERSGPRAKAAEVSVEIEPGSISLAEVDGGRVETAVYHLIANAIDAAAQSGDRRVGVRLVDRGNTILTEVTDHGPGVPPSDTIFEPFYSTKQGGTGLGLAIVQLVATDHNGTVSHERVRDATVFRLCLPIVAGVAN